MKQLKFMDETYEAERIVKTSDSIIGYIGDNEVFSMRGISDFSGFELLDGAEWDMPTPTQIDEVKSDLSLMINENIKREIDGLDLKQQNNVLGGELVKRELQIADLNMQLQALGSMVSGIELRLLAKINGREAELDV